MGGRFEQQVGLQLADFAQYHFVQRLAPAHVQVQIQPLGAQRGDQFLEPGARLFERRGAPFGLQRTIE